ncbi:DUF3833 family protein [Sphingomonas sp. GB1N7]|uniref:DUF3833 family protein n=1 Tax=Parasphingomonas caseinilytica TaxID=3096158 RepID=UPI002FC75A0A
MIRIGWLLLVSLAGCTSAPPLRTLASSSPSFDALAFFSGRTEGEARLKIVASRTKQVRVHGTGTIDPDGTLHLVQRVDQEGKPETTRIWTIHATRQGGYSGTLSDAGGPILGDVTGNRLHLRFRLKSGLRADQWLYLQPGGAVARNRMTVRKLGIVVARLDETIKRLP